MRTLKAKKEYFRTINTITSAAHRCQDTVPSIKPIENTVIKPTCVLKTKLIKINKRTASATGLCEAILQANPSLALDILRLYRGVEYNHYVL